MQVNPYLNFKGLAMPNVAKWLLLMMLSPGVMANQLVLNTHVALTGIAVSSVCSVTVSSNSSQNGMVDFGIYDKSMRKGELSQPFTLNLRESGATSNGCSAFQSGLPFVTVTFGDKTNKQLDRNGVITHGTAGDSVRIEVVAMDKREASYLKPITDSHNNIQYSQQFASKGTFKFAATAKYLDSASAGDYRGELSVVFTYK